MNPQQMLHGLPKDLIAEIGELGLDSITILKSVLLEF
jgi:hypothetical protein